jgi:hypothetical protein
MNIPILSRFFKRNHKQIVVLLGAGAAYPWDIEFKDSKVNITERILKKFSGDDFAKAILNTLDNYYKGKKKYNFETFLAVVEELLNYTFASTTPAGNANNKSFLPSIFDINTELVKLLPNNEVKKKKFCFDKYNEYINIIIEEIKSYNDNVLTDEHNETINENLIKFTKYFLKRNYAVKFYTTNYDSIIPQVLECHFEVYEGLINSSTTYKRFNYDLSRFRKACISHFNLHGSIFLRKEMLEKYETVYDLDSCIKIDRVTENSGNPGELLVFSPIVTGYNKTQKISNRPFDLGFQAFANDCNDCKALVTVGCSFSDPHINSIISNFIKWDTTTMLDVNPSSALIEKDYYISDFIEKEEKKEDSTWVHDISGKKHIYKGDFNSFLSDSNNWKCLINK